MDTMKCEFCTTVILESISANGILMRCKKHGVDKLQNTMELKSD